MIHETAIVDEGAVIGEGTRIWHWVHVSSGARVGRDCSIGQGCYVAGDVVIGDGCRIQNGVSVFDAVRLEDDVFCGPNMVFTNVTNPRAAVARKDEYRTTLVRRGATIGANATIVCGVTLGCHAFVAAGAVVTHDVPDHALVAGVPARRIGWMSARGVRLDLPVSGAGEARCPEAGDRYVLDGESVSRSPA